MMTDGNGAPSDKENVSINQLVMLKCPPSQQNSNRKREFQSTGKLQRKRGTGIQQKMTDGRDASAFQRGLFCLARRGNTFIGAVSRTKVCAFRCNYWRYNPLTA